MPRLRRAAEPRHVHQRGVADVIPPAQRDQALGHEGAVEACQHGDIRDRAECDMMKCIEQVRLGPLGRPETTRAQLAVYRHQRDEDETDRGPMAKPRQIVGPVRIDQRVDDRKIVAALMVIDHHHVHAELFGFSQRLDAGGAAVHGHQQRGALRGKAAHGFDIGTVAFEDAIRNMDQRIEPAMAQMPCQQRRRRRAVHVVVAKDRDLFAAHRRIRDTLGGGLHLRHGQGIREQLADGRIEKILHGIDVDAASRDDARQHLRHLIALRDGERARRAARIKPVAPHTAGRGPRHAEKGGRRLNRQCGNRKRHDAVRR